MNPSPLIVLLDAATLPLPVPELPIPCRWQSHPHSAEDEVVERLAGATVAITNKVPIRRGMLRQLPDLKLIAVAATGYNQIDLPAAKEHGVAVCNIRDYAVHGVAEHTMMLMLALRRQLLAYRRDVEQGMWQQAPGFCLFGATMHDLAGSRLALVGSGALGQATATLARVFGMDVHFVERKGAAGCRLGYLPWEEAFGTADVVSLHCPLTEGTRSMVGAAELARMKPSALLLNTARGGLVDEAALLDALQGGRLAGAGLDVLVAEPPRAGNPLLDVRLPNLIVTPHVAWASVETVQTLVDQLVGNVAGFLQGRPRNLL